jgi:hypothetical protein
MFDAIRECRQRYLFSVILGVSGEWQIQETDSEAEFGVDTRLSSRRRRAVLDVAGPAFRPHGALQQRKSGSPLRGGRPTKPRGRRRSGQEA